MRNRFLATAVALTCLSEEVLARNYNPTLGAFFDPSTGTVDTKAFQNYAGELGVAMVPKSVGPASTLGSMGFEVSYDLSLTDINRDNYYWKGNSALNVPAVSQDPSSLLMTSQLRIRKGLPYSLQLGGVITHLQQSDLWGIGLELGWALQEGFRYIPDFAVVSSVNTILGAGDLAMIEVGSAFLVSKSFSVAGLFSLAPVFGYHMVYINAGSHITNTFVTTQGVTSPMTFVIGQQNIFRHRALVGLNAIVTVLTLGAEVGIAPGQRTYSFKLGVTF